MVAGTAAANVAAICPDVGEFWQLDDCGQPADLFVISGADGPRRLWCLGPWRTFRAQPPEGSVISVERGVLEFRAAEAGHAAPA
jgi:hypothetical protein